MFRGAARYFHKVINNQLCQYRNKKTILVRSREGNHTERWKQMLSFISTSYSLTDLKQQSREIDQAVFDMMFCSRPGKDQDLVFEFF